MQAQSQFTQAFPIAPNLPYLTNTLYPNSNMQISYVNPLTYLPMQQSMMTNLENTQKPYSAFFHVFFKGLVFFSYIILPLISQGSGILFEAIMMYSLLDFWTVKNVSGRLLLGMRWWIEIGPSGDENWVCECKAQKKASLSDEGIFWGIQGIATLLWSSLLIASIINFNFSLVILMSITVGQSGFNLWAFSQCRKSKQINFKFQVRDKRLEGILKSFGHDKLFVQSVKIAFKDEEDENVNAKNDTKV